MQQRISTYDDIDCAAVSRDTLWVIYGGVLLRLCSLLTGSIDLLLGLGLHTSSPAHTLGSPMQRVRACCFSPDSSSAAATRGSELLVFEVPPTASKPTELTAGADDNSPLVACALAAKGSAAAAANAAGGVLVWRLPSFGRAAPVVVRLCVPPASAPTTPAEFALMITQMAAPYTQMEAHAAAPPALLPTVSCLCFAGRSLVAGGADGLFIWDVPHLEEYASANGDGDGGGGGGGGGDPRMPIRCSGAVEVTSCVAARVSADDGAALLLSCEDSGKVVRLRSAGTGRVVLSINPRRISSPAGLCEGEPSSAACAAAVALEYQSNAPIRYAELSASGRFVFTLSGIQHIRLFDTRDGRELQCPAKLRGPVSLDRVCACALSEDDSALVGLERSRHGKTSTFARNVGPALKDVFAGLISPGSVLTPKGVQSRAIAISRGKPNSPAGPISPTSPTARADEGRGSDTGGGGRGTGGDVGLDVARLLRVSEAQKFDFEAPAHGCAADDEDLQSPRAHGGKEAAPSARRVPSAPSSPAVQRRASSVASPIFRRAPATSTAAASPSGGPEEVRRGHVAQPPMSSGEGDAEGHEEEVKLYEEEESATTRSMVTSSSFSTSVGLY